MLLTNASFAFAVKSSPTTQLQQEFVTLVKNKKQAGLRHNWERLERKIETFLKKNPNDPEGLLLAGETREELAKRSFLPQDFIIAAQKYERFVERLPKNNQVPEVLFLQAKALARGQKINVAKGVLTHIIKEYPRAPVATRAQQLITQLAKEPVKQSAKQPATAHEKPISLVDQLGLNIQTIVIDAGHGGKDPGAMARGVVEKDFTLALAKRLGALLQKKGFVVIYTREKDRSVALEKRPIFANDKKADLFISIHINANKETSVRGVETYYLDTAQSKGAAAVAARENGVSVKELSNLQFILTDLMLSSKLKESRQLASFVHKSILQNLKKNNLTMPDNGVRSAPFYVLYGAKMPAILLECGYITNAEDAKLLQSEQFLQHQVNGLLAGVLAYKKQLESTISK